VCCASNFGLPNLKAYSRAIETGIPPQLSIIVNKDLSKNNLNTLKL